MYTLVSHRNHTGRMCGDPPPRKVAMTPSGVGKVWARFFGDGHRSARGCTGSPSSAPRPAELTRPKKEHVS
jgi:hypothetical protein